MKLRLPEIETLVSSPLHLHIRRPRLVISELLLKDACILCRVSMGFCMVRPKLAFEHGVFPPKRGSQVQLRVENQSNRSTSEKTANAPPLYIYQQDIHANHTGS